MSSKIPTREELETFLKRQIAEARRLKDQDRCDRLLEQLFDLDGSLAFVTQVLSSPSPDWNYAPGVENLLG